MDTTDSVGGWGEVGDTFHMTYRGNSEIDRHYSKPMLPWIISEIKNRHKAVQVSQWENDLNLSNFAILQSCNVGVNSCS